MNNIRSATKSIGEGISASMEVNLDMAVEYIQVRHNVDGKENSFESIL